jgi:hypothetical protein
MDQTGRFDLAHRYAGLDAKNDPLVKINDAVPWEEFRPQLEAVWRVPPAERASPAGRKPWDAVVMFKAIVLCELYNLSDEQSASRPAVVHAVPWAGPCGPGP